MKKVLSLILALALCISLAACGASEKAEPTNENPIETTAAPIETTEAPVETTAEPTEAATESAMAAIEAYVNENKAALLATMEQSFATSSGMTCTSDIAVVDNGIVITININELDNVDQATKDQLQSTYSSMDTAFEELLTELQKEIPQVEYLTIVIGEVDGDVLASLTADGTVADTASQVAKFVEENKADLLTSMEESFATSSGYTCTSDIRVEGNGFIISININEFDNMDQSVKDQLQTTYDGMAATFEDLLTQLQQLVPGLEYYTIEVNEVDGDNLAIITAGKK